MKQNSEFPESDDINLVELLQKIWQGRIIAIKMGSLFAILGIIFAINSPNVYVATTTFIPKGQSSGSVGGSLSGLASLAGINLGSMSGGDSEIPLTLYPMLIKSNPFISLLLESELPSKKGNFILKDYLSEDTAKSLLFYIKRYTLGLPSQIKLWLMKREDLAIKSTSLSNLKSFSLEEEGLFNKLKESINISVDRKEGFITLTAEEKSPEIAAIIAANAQALLQKEVINFKIKNAKELLMFTERLYHKKRELFEKLQDELATFRDQNQNINSSLYQNKLNRLETDVAIASTVNEELAKQVEQARIQVSRDTPVFTIIDPVVIPNKRSKPQRSIIVLVFTLFGFMFGLGFFLIKDPFILLKRQILLENKTN